MAVKQQAESYLTFTLNNGLFAINVVRVLEILEVIPIAKVPGCAAFMRGVINLRGNILPVIDTRGIFGMNERPFAIDTCIIVMSIGGNKEPILVGALVDAVKEVVEISNEAIQPATGIGPFYKDEYMTGMGKTGEEFVMILDPDKVFAAPEMFAVTNNL